MFRIALAVAGAFSLTIASSAAPETQATPLPVDVETSVNGIDVACTGIGQTRDEERWKTYGVRVEFSNAGNEYLAGGAIVLRDRWGRRLLSASCEAPWILLRLPERAYRVEGWVPGSSAKPRSAAFTAPAQGQIRVVLQFKELGAPPAER